MKEKGAVMILIVLILMMVATGLFASHGEGTISRQKDFLFGTYYERAIASALSCREVAMARLSANFQYVSSTTTPPEAVNEGIACSYSVIKNQTSPANSRDFYVDVVAVGNVSSNELLPISLIIKSTLMISFASPKIEKTFIYF
ncbi:MAG: hypothetical protein WCG97_02625 [bacterium]